MVEFLISQVPQMCIRGKAFKEAKLFEFFDELQASSQFWPFQTIFEFKRVCETFQICFVKGRDTKMCIMLSSPFLHRVHHPGPSRVLFFISFQVGILLSRACHMNNFSFRGKFSFQIAFCHQGGSSYCVVELKC